MPVLPSVETPRFVVHPAVGNTARNGRFGKDFEGPKEGSDQSRWRGFRCPCDPRRNLRSYGTSCRTTTLKPPGRQLHLFHDLSRMCATDCCLSVALLRLLDPGRWPLEHEFFLEFTTLVASDARLASALPLLDDECEQAARRRREHKEVAAHACTRTQRGRARREGHPQGRRLDPSPGPGMSPSSSAWR
jgi:hypothetical protein